MGATIGCTVALAACGSSGSHQSSGATASAPAEQSGEATKPPAQILTDAASALRSARGYVMQGQLMQSGSPEHVRIVAQNRSLEVAIKGGTGALGVIILPAAAYIRMDQTFLNSHGAGPPGLKPNVWVRIPATSAQTLAAQLGQFSPHVIARCLVEGHGKLSLAGSETVSGQKAVVIRDAGNVPGGAPGTLAVAASGTPYPLQVRETGAKRAGGRIDVCNDGRAEDSRGEFTFSRFGAPPPITAPNHAAQTGQQSGAI